MHRSKYRAMLSRVATTFGGIIIGSLLYTTTVFANLPLIMEVQSVNEAFPEDPPDQLVVYGRNFGLIRYGGSEDPKFTFGTGRVGTYNGFLPFAADQSL